MERFRSKGAARAGAILGSCVLAVASLAACSSSSHPSGSAAPAASNAARVLLVGTFAGRTGQYRTIQSAVNAARPGDWILVAPGDYHENADLIGPASEYVSSGGFGGV